MKFYFNSQERQTKSPQPSMTPHKSKVLQLPDSSSSLYTKWLINTHTKDSSPQIHKLLETCVSPSWSVKCHFYLLRGHDQALNPKRGLVRRVHEPAINTEVLFWGWCSAKHHFLIWASSLAKPFLPAQLNLYCHRFHTSYSDY